MTKLNDNIYIKTLKLGFENPYNVTLKQVIDNAELNEKLDSSNEYNLEFKLTFLLWFYSNFHSKSIRSITDIANIKNNVNEAIKRELDKTAIITGDAVNKYIDYLELKQAREDSASSKVISGKAQLVAYISLGITIIALTVQVISSFIVKPTHKPIEVHCAIDPDNRNELQKHEPPMPN